MLMPISPPLSAPAHTLPLESLYRELDSSAAGLAQAEAERRLTIQGPNILPRGSQVTLAQVILHQFTSPLIYILLLAAGLSLLSHEYTDAAFIGLVLGLNALIGSLQEWRAEKQAAALQQLIQVEVRARRDGKWHLLKAEDLVCGDVVLIEAGMKVPADIRLIRGSRLEAEEAMLTGESMPVNKQPGTLEEAALPLGDRSNLLYAGTTLLQGQGEGLVAATGAASEIGQIAQSVAGSSGSKTPLVERMERFARKITWLVLVAGVLVVAIGLLRGNDLMEMVLFAIAMAVSAIPEGLPVAMTIALAIGAARMARHQVIVRKLAAVEGLGSCTLIASDKTGTLTVDQQTVKQIWLADGTHLEVLGEGYNGEGAILGANQAPVEAEDLPPLQALLHTALLCNEGLLSQDEQGWHQHGDAVDVALLALGAKAGLDAGLLRDRYERVQEIPFMAEHKYAAVYSRSNSGLRLDVKGAPEALLAWLTPKQQLQVSEMTEALSAGGYRVIALANAHPAHVSESLPPLNLLGLVGLIDPVKPDAAEAVAKCQAAGITVAMVTGDHPATALAIAQSLGIADSPEAVVTGQMLEHAGEPERLIQTGRVFARVNPAQKLQIVEALQQTGHFVAVTGDGVNDAPALKQAHIGVAMGYGTDVAKESASLIVTDNRLGSIAAAVEQGRQTYANIRKIIYLLISTGAAEVGLVILALASGLPLPFLPVQLLWLNLVTNGLQDVALAFERGEPDVMKRPPRDPQERVFDQQMMRQMLLSGGLISLVCFVVWSLLLGSGVPEAEARSQLLLLMVCFQNFHALNCRSESRSAFALPFAHNPFLLSAILGAQSLHIAAMYLPIGQQVLGLTPPTLSQWLIYLALGSSILWLMEGDKWFRRRRA
ncbi:MAG: ATPase [Candidatus Melainabacteria bacterium HGW-Melainabacteria-1]|nr:MAG: ATPase [Candidatus Melainabacteria bacterium HGW-Melainabacteria-1]